MVRELLRGFTARDLMNRDVPTVDPDRDAFELLGSMGDQGGGHRSHPDLRPPDGYA